MEFKTTKTELSSALANLVRNADPKQPFYANIELSEKNGQLQLKSSNGIITITQTIKADITDITPVAVPALKLYEIVSRLEEVIEFYDGMLVSGKNKIVLPITDKLTLPNLNFETALFKVKTDSLNKALKGRIFACESNTQGVLGGVCINGDEVVSTNGNIMAIGKMEKLPFEETIIDVKLAQEITKVFGEEYIQVGFEGNKVIFMSDNKELISMLKHGHYPKYKQIIPASTAHEVKLNKHEMLKSLDLIKLMVDERLKTCGLKFYDNTLTLLTGENTSKMDIDYTGEEITIWLNIEYLINALKNIEEDFVSFGFNDPRSACILKTDADTTLIMPVQKSA